MGVKPDDDSESGMNNTIQSSYITEHDKYIVYNTLLVLDLLRQIEVNLKVGVITGYRHFFVSVVEV